MSLDQTFSPTLEQGQPLHIFLKKGHHRFVAEPGRLLKPLLDALDGFHRAGRTHGAVMPSRLRVSPAGEFDLGFFLGQAGQPDPGEAFTYYPDGYGDSPDDRRNRDLQALGAVLHLIVTDQAPARPGRRAQQLAEHPDSRNWPEEFIGLLDRLLESGLQGEGPSLAEIASALTGLEEKPAGPAAALPNPAAEMEDTPTPAAPESPAAEIEIPAVTDEEAPAEEDGKSTAQTPTGPSVQRLPAFRLPNAMVARHYSADLATLGVASLDPIEVLSEMPVGLTLDGGLLCGSPELAGEYEILLRWNPSPAETGTGTLLEREVIVTINPDPRSLWKNTPSDPDGEFAKPDTATEILADSPLAVLGASLRGRSHAHVGGYRDDDLAMTWFPGTDWYSLTVADGAGSAKYSRQGSRIACETVKQHLTAYFTAEQENPLTRLVDALALAPDDMAATGTVRGELYQLFGSAALMARRSVEVQAAECDATARDFHTTLITVLLHPLADGRWFVAAFSVGDGAAAIITGGSPCLLTTPDGGEFAGQTVFLTMKEALSSGESILARIRMAIVPSFDALLLVTDGISDPRFDSATALADPAGWNVLWQEIRDSIAGSGSREAAAEALLEWMGFHSPGHHDDRTVILATSPALFPQP